MKLLKNNNGFTLIEAVVSIVVLGVLGSLLASLLFQGASIYDGESTRQRLMNESRMTIWKIILELHNQMESSSFVLSDQEHLYIDRADGKKKEFLLQQNNSVINYKTLPNNYNILSDNFNYSLSTGFKYYDKNFSEITPSLTGLTSTQAEQVCLPQIDLTFTDINDTINYSFFIYPYNFRFGLKKSFHE